MIEAVDYVVDNYVDAADQNRYGEVLETIRPTILVASNGKMYNAAAFAKDGVDYVLDFDWNVDTEENWRGDDYKLLTDEDNGGIVGQDLYNNLNWIASNIGSRKAFLSKDIEDHAVPKISDAYVGYISAMDRDFQNAKNSLLQNEARLKSGIELTDQQQLSVGYKDGAAFFDIVKNK